MGCIRLSPPGTQNGDLISVASGVHSPVLPEKKVDKWYKLVGLCYFQGLTTTEAAPVIDAEKTISIVQGVELFGIVESIIGKNFNNLPFERCPGSCAWLCCVHAS
jgi:hypothetical protein